MTQAPVTTKEKKTPKLELFQAPAKTPETPQQKPQPTTQQPKTTPPEPPKKTEYKPIPEETKILLDALEEIEGILYGARQKIYQLYGPVEYKPLSDIELEFTEHEARLLTFEQIDNTWIIRVRQRLEKEEFAKIASKVRSLGGEYVSAGKDSHFRVRRS